MRYYVEFYGKYVYDTSLGDFCTAICSADPLCAFYVRPTIANVAVDPCDFYTSDKLSQLTTLSNYITYIKNVYTVSTG